MDVIAFYQKALQLKHVVRTGWSYKSVPDPESVADHTYGVALLALIVPLPEEIDRDRLIKMALVHDVGESLIGDVVWEQGKKVNKPLADKKHLREEYAVAEIFEHVNADEFKELAQEFIRRKSSYAVFLRQLDKLEMCFQALDYEQRVDPVVLDEFWINSEGYIKDAQLKKIFEAIKEKRMGVRRD